MSFCDALGLNLAAALAVAGLGLALAAGASRRAPAWARVAMLGAAAAAAGATWLALDPQCMHGPFAAMDPAVRPFWFGRIQEVQPMTAMLTGPDRTSAMVAIAMMAMTLGAGAWLLARQWRAPPTPIILAFASLVAASAMGTLAWRMQDYVFWIGVPVLGAAVSLIAERRLADLMVPSLVAATVLSPSLLGGAAGAAANVVAPDRDPPPPKLEKCSRPSAYRALAALPPGVVLSETDLGSFILAYTRHSAVAAPYHRMTWGILAGHQALNAPPALAEARVRRLGATLVVDCPPYPMVVDDGSFGARLRNGETPSWLEPLSAPGATLTVFRVRPKTTSPLGEEGAHGGAMGR